MAVISQTLAVGTICLLFYAVTTDAWSAFKTNSSIEGIVDLPIWPTKFIMVVGMVFFFLAGPRSTLGNADWPPEAATTRNRAGRRIMDFLTGGILCVVLLLIVDGRGHAHRPFAFLLGGFLISALLLGFRQFADPVGAGGLFFHRCAHLGRDSAVHPDGEFRVERRAGAPGL